jgi:hypothetical protein
MEQHEKRAYNLPGSILSKARSSHTIVALLTFSSVQNDQKVKGQTMSRCAWSLLRKGTVVCLVTRGVGVFKLDRRYNLVRRSLF